MSVVATTILLFVSSAVAAQPPYPNLPLSFERQGARFIARGRGYGIALGKGKATLGIRGDQASVISLEFAGGSSRPASPGPELPGKANYIRGSDPRLWQFGLPTYARVTYCDIYPGIDVAYYGDQRQLEFDLVLRPGADPPRIRMKFRGANRVALGPDGVLLAGGFRVPLPAIFQESGGARKTIQGRYVLLPNREVAFHVNAYDRAMPLVIDPTIVYAGLLGGGTDDTYGFGVAVDPDGNAYIAGGTYASDFPTANAAFPLWGGDEDGFVTKINPTGTAIVYSTFVGGSATDVFYNIALDSTRSAYVTGYSDSTDFPTANAYQSSSTGDFTAVVLKLNPSGGLAWSTFLGDNSHGYGIAVDPSGNAYTTGYVDISGTLPTTAGVSSSAHANEDAFAAKFSPTGSLLYATYVGGAGSDFGESIAVDAAGSLALGSSARIQNSQCSVALTSAAGSGSTFNLVLNISFTTSFGGNRILYAAARDQELDNTNWQAMGVWQVTFTPPGTIAVGAPAPARGSALSGTALTIAIPLTDTKGAADIGIVDVLVNSSIDGRQACYIGYAAASPDFSSNLPTERGGEGKAAHNKRDGRLRGRGWGKTVCGTPPP